MLRRAAVVIGFGLGVGAGAAGCGGAPAKDTGPAWPKSAGWEPAESWEEDGGETLEPKTNGDVAAIERSEDASRGGEVGDAIDVEVIEVVAPAAGDGAEAPPAGDGEPKVDDTFVPEETIIIIEGEPTP